MTRARFEELVDEAVLQLPEMFREHLRDVVIMIEDQPSDEDLLSLGLDPRRDTIFGLYDGTPLSERIGDAGLGVPDRIVIYYRPLVREFRTAWSIRNEIRKTVIHEVAHFFGLDEDQVAEEGYE